MASATPPVATPPFASAPATHSTSSNLPSSSPTPGQVIGVEAARALRISAAEGPDFAILADGYLFTTDVGGGVEVYDEAGKQLTKLEIPGGACAAPDAGFGAVWTATCSGMSGLVRIDTASFGAAPVMTQSRIPSSESTIGVGEGGVWMILTGSPNQLVRVDNQVQARKIDFSEAAPQGATAVRVGFGSVWISSPGENMITRIDPATGKTVATITVGKRPQFFVVGENAVWTLDQLGESVSRIDPSTNSVAATIDLGEVVQGGDIAVGGGFVWARSSATLLFKIDEQTNEVVARYGPPSGSGSVAADDQYVWITAHDVDAIWRLPVN